MTQPERLGLALARAPRVRQLGRGWVWSRGLNLPVWLGPAELRVWRELERRLPRRRRPIDVVLRAIARELELNPGSLARILSRLHGLRLLEHATRGRGRFGGIRLGRIVELVTGIRPLDDRRRARALARNGISLDPGAGVAQLELALLEGSS